MRGRVQEYRCLNAARPNCVNHRAHKASKIAASATQCVAAPKIKQPATTFVTFAPFSAPKPNASPHCSARGLSAQPQIRFAGQRFVQNSRNRRDQTKRAVYLNGFARECKCIFSITA